LSISCGQVSEHLLRDLRELLILTEFVVGQ
jgi:hypothetical protein